MKRRVKQKIKSIVSFSMALALALMPMDGVIPVISNVPVQVYAEAGVTYDDDYISSVTTYEDETLTNVLEASETIDESATYYLKVTPNSTYKTLFGLTVDDYYIQDVLGSELNAGYNVTRTTVSAVTIVPDIANASNLSISGADIDVDAVSNDCVIKAGISLPCDNEVTFEFKAPVKCVYSGSGVTAGAVSGTKRSWTYTVSVDAIMANLESTIVDATETFSAKASLSSSETTKKTLSLTNVTATIPSAYRVSGDANSFYLPLLADEKYNITLTPMSGYALTSITGVSTMPTAGESYDYEVSYSTGNITAEAELILDAPEVSFVSPKEYYRNQAVMEVDYTIPDTFPAGYDLYYYIADDATTVPADASGWTEIPASKKVTVDYTTEAEASKYILFCYSDGSRTGEYVRKEVKFDNVAPVFDGISFPEAATIDGSKWAKETTTILLEASDHASGVAGKMKYAFVDTTSPVDPTLEEVAGIGGVFEIPYSMNDRKTISGDNVYLYYEIKDAVGNVIKNTVPIDAMKFDSKAPTALTVGDNVDFYVGYTSAGGGSANKKAEDINDWQIVPIMVTVAATDADAPAGEFASGIGKVTFADDFGGGNNVTVNTADALGNYAYAVIGDGVHHIVATAYDKVGNAVSSDTLTVKVDAGGIKDSVVTLTPASANYSQAFDVQASARSVCGIKSITYNYKIGSEVITGTVYDSQIEKSDNSYTVKAPVPLELLDQKTDVYVSVIFEDECNRTTIENSTIFSVNTKGSSIVFQNQDKSWNSKDILVPIVVKDEISGIKSVDIQVDGGTVTTVSTSETQNSYLVTINENSPSTGTKVTVTVINGADATTVGECVYKLDKQAPDISLSGITEGSVSNTNRTLTITTTENVWQEMKPITITATKTIDGITSDIDLGTYNASEGSSVTTRDFTEDGLYEVTVSAEDAAGNKASKSISFTIDKTAPVLSITGITDGAYSGNAVTLNFQAVESFYATDKVSISVNRKFEGAVSDSTVDFVNSGKISNVSSTFSSDGDYTVTMTAVDGAGNVAATQTVSFTVDVSAPVISITGTQDYFITMNPITLQFTVTESYYETNQVTISGKRRTADGKETNLNFAAWDNSGKVSTRTEEFKEDGAYTILLYAKDRAGHQVTREIHFTIDTEKPVIADLSKYNGYFTSFKIEEKLEDLIVELTAPTIVMTLNGEAYDGSEVKEEGKYTFNLEVTDEVGLSNSASAEFIIDNTAPKVIFAGVENGKTYTEPVKVNVSLENTSDTIEQILINDKSQSVSAGTSSYDYDISDFGKYEIKVKTSDAAGNTNDQSISFTYAEHKNTGFLWIIIVTGVLAAGLVIGLIVSSKRKR